MAPDQRHGAGDRHRGVAEQGHPGSRDMDVHDPNRFALLIVWRRLEEAQIQAGADAQHGQPCDPGQERICDTQELVGVREPMHKGLYSGEAVPCQKSFRRTQFRRVALGVQCQTSHC